MKQCINREQQRFTLSTNLKVGRSWPSAPPTDSSPLLPPLRLPLPLPLGHSSTNGSWVQYPFKKTSKLSTEGSVPEGRTTIAQRFNVGAGVVGKISPEGTADGCREWARRRDLSRPFGTYLPLTVGPNVETLGYYQASLRDELQNPSAIGQECPRPGSNRYQQIQSFKFFLNRRHLSLSTVRSCSTALLLLCLAPLIGLLATGCSKKSEPPAAASEKDQKEESRVKRGPNGETTITLDAATQQLIGIQTTALRAAQVSPEIKAYGNVLQAALLVTQVADVTTAQAASQASQAELQRLRTLAGQNNASQRALQAAEATAAHDQAQLESARLRLEANLGVSLANRPDLPALIQSLASLSNALVRLNLAAGETLPGAPIAARILTLASNALPIEASFLGLAPVIDPQMQGPGFLFLVSPNSAGLLPGAAVTGYIVLPGEARAGVRLPRDAIVRYKGAAWVYRQTSDDTFQRVEVALAEPLQDGWFVRERLKANEKVVTAASQLLLSEELKAAAGE